MNTVKKKINWFEPDPCENTLVTVSLTGCVGEIEVFNIIPWGNSNKYEVWSDLPGMNVRNYKIHSSIKEAKQEAEEKLEQWISMFNKDNNILE